MQICILRENQLSADHREAWDHLQCAWPLFDSPYFRPEFLRAVASVRPNVEIAVLKQAGELVGFFPFERGIMGTAQPLGNVLSDFHGVIASPHVHWSPRELLEACGLKSWTFHHLLAQQEPFHPFHWREADSPFMDLSLGYEAYRVSRRGAGSLMTKRMAQRKRKLEREHGTVTFDSDCREEAVFQQMLRWKSQQYRVCGLVDLFASPWIVELLRKIWQNTSPAFRGRLFALFVQGELVAVEFAMQSHRVLHSWFPCYNRAYARYGTGNLL
ncbi:MAG: GNAT family N-acetyltransferase, partial [Planctomycetaceae bacterium]|nr:GNAT family N-acetyltransferase [Planctomycetaceae bacterium]